MINETVANATRAAHDVGLAAWLGGAMWFLRCTVESPRARLLKSHSSQVL
jgi:hypothetical protein